MCEKSQNQKTNKVISLLTRRSSIWNLPVHQLCPVIGTCLDVKQLKRLKNRFMSKLQGVQLETDYDLHSYFVSVSSSKNPMSVYINKTLNKQYQRFVSDINKHKSDEAIEAVWDKISSTDLNSLAGYFWAIITSKYASEVVKNRVYGEIHMISHIAGQANKNDVQALLHDKQQVTLDLAKKDRLIASKNHQLEQQKNQIFELKQRNTKIKLQLSVFQNKPHTTGLSTQDYQRQIVDQEHKILRLQQRIKKLENKPQQKKAQEVTLRSLFESAQQKTKTCNGNCSECQRTDLCGKKILYVGGFSRHRQKFNQLTRSINGEFFYHDGGMQQSEHLLNDLVRKADCIFCPIDCISHSAMGRIKSLAKTHCKDCIFLRSASLSSFNQEIRRYAN